jgi:hypothetical protein
MRKKKKRGSLTPQSKLLSFIPFLQYNCFPSLFHLLHPFTMLCKYCIDISTALIRNPEDKYLH